MYKLNKAFTLVELVVILGIISILASLTLVAINPAKHFSQARDAQRNDGVNQILNSVTQYMADNQGQLPAGITTTPTNIGNGSGNVDICSLLVDEYIAEMPVDPQNGTYNDCSDYDTNYLISKSATNNRVTVSAPSAENDPISVTR